MIERLLRGSAIVIAVAAGIDPALTVSGRVRPRVGIAVGADVDRAQANGVRDRLVQDLRADFDVIDGVDAGAAGAVIVADRYPDVALPPQIPVFTVTLPSVRPPNVSVAAIRAPAQAPPHTAIPVEADVDAVGAQGLPSTLTLTVNGVEVGRVVHTWHTNRERWRAALDAVPVGDPPFVVRVKAEPLSGERTTSDNAAGVLVAAADHALRVLAYERRPSWAATFVRRALEADARFVVSGVDEVSRGVAVRAGAPLPLADTSKFDTVDAILVGGLEQLTAADVIALERFMRERGGSVALLPDGQVEAGPARDLMPAPLSPVVVDAHAPLVMKAPLPRIDASEMLVLRGDAFDGDALARASGSNGPVIAVVPHGDGRLLFSGALDAWRSRAEHGVEFDRFWQSAIAALALATPPLLEVSVAPSLPAAGDRLRVVAHLRGVPRAVSATLDTGEVVRLWPGASAGVFTGSFAAPRGGGVHTIDVAAEGTPPISGRGTFLVGAGVRTPSPAAPLSLAAASHGGVDVDVADLPALERDLRAKIAPTSAPIRRRPMRSPWWLLPFAGCLSGEWWLRRRRGRR